MCRTSTQNVLRTEQLKKEDAWLETFDIVAFTDDIKALGQQFNEKQGPDDVAHLRRMVRWSNTFGLVGFLAMALGFNPISVIGLSTYAFSRWTMIAHHTCHGGYDRCHPEKGRWNRFKFAVGSLWRRFCDWLDWMMPEAWNVEHNNRHHYCLSELNDPDLVENNASDLREANVPLPLKYVAVLFLMSTWKWFYYAPNTYKELKLAEYRKKGKKIPEGVHPEDSVTLKGLLTTGTVFYSLPEFLIKVAGPYFVFYFGMLPLPFYFLGEYLEHTTGMALYQSALMNLVCAEVLTNIHGFLAVVPNHAGNDMYRFRYGCRPFSPSFYVRQVIASVDFNMGCDSVDFFHGWLNYQIEHHLWPNLSMLSYQRAAPEVEAICKKHGIPYIKENVFLRCKKTIDIMTGTANMRSFPESYEKHFLQIDAAYQSREDARKLENKQTTEKE